VRSRSANSASRFGPAAAALVALAFLVPVAYAVYPTVAVLSRSLVAEGSWSLRHYRTFLETPNARAALFNSLWLSLASVALAGGIGTALAFLFGRLQFPLRAPLSALVVFPYALPPLLGTLSLYYLLGPSGIVPRLLGGPLALSGFGAVLAVHAYTLYPLFYLFVSAALRSLDRTQLEAAAALGASPARVFREVTLPHLRPALLGASLLVFMASMASFSAPLFFAGDRNVLSLAIYHARSYHDLGLCYAETAALAAVSLGLLVALQALGVANPGARASGKAGAPLDRRRLAGAPGALAAAGGVALVVALLAPHLLILLLAFAKNGTWTDEVLPPVYTLENLARLFRDPATLQPLGNSLAMAGVAAVANAAYGLVGGWLLARRLRRGRPALTLLVLLPWALPGTVIGIALVAAFGRAHPLAFGGVLVGSWAILPLAYFLRNLPLTVQPVEGALARLDPAIEDAARSLGAPAPRAFRLVTLPLVLPGLVAGTLLAFVNGLGEFVASVLLYTGRSTWPVSVAIYSELRSFRFGTAFAYGALVLLVIGALLPLAARLARR
jgi:iron(III) transport system permease protein